MTIIVLVATFSFCILPQKSLLFTMFIELLQWAHYSKLLKSHPSLFCHCLHIYMYFSVMFPLSDFIPTMSTLDIIKLICSLISFQASYFIYLHYFSIVFLSILLSVITREKGRVEMGKGQVDISAHAGWGGGGWGSASQMMRVNYIHPYMLTAQCIGGELYTLHLLS
jgi:hypothetical protein